MVQVPITCHKISITKIDTMNGSLFIKVIQRMTNRPMPTSNGETVKITWNSRILTITSPISTSYFWVKMYSSQVSMEESPILLSMQEKVHLRREMILNILQMHSNLTRDHNQYQRENQLNQQQMTKTNMQVNSIIMLQMWTKHLHQTMHQLNMVTDFGLDS